MKQEAEWEDLGNSQVRDWLRHHSDVTTDKAKEGTGKELQTLFQGAVVCLPTTSCQELGSQWCPFCSGTRPGLRGGRKEQMTG